MIAGSVVPDSKGPSLNETWKQVDESFPEKTLSRTLNSNKSYELTGGLDPSFPVLSDMLL